MLDTQQLPDNAAELATFSVTMVETLGKAWAAVHELNGTGRLLPWERMDAAIQIAAVFAEVETHLFGEFGTLLALDVLEDVENYDVWSA